MTDGPRKPRDGERSTLAWALHAVAPVVLGGVIYLGWRTRGLLLWDWAAEAGLDAALGALRGGLLAALAAPPAWVRFSLPDALWVYALTWSVARLQRPSRPLVRAAWLSVPALLGPGAELLQLVGLPGTFDRLDLALCLLAFALGAWRGLSPASRTSPSASPP
ncbi:MAG TPA: hypothetical protein RMH99_21560 [Sandaracinaceae bacterium LLY-WYZ-13_1]|nr:hypothetical protein [Sandaracinaceae bacterium LLY-WYZ-13_1]